MLQENGTSRPVLVDATHPLWSVVERLCGSELVKGVALVGSRVGDLAVPDSDYDVFIYTEGTLRTSALASYVDIVFAVNRVLHPGEKRILESLARECASLPAGALMMIERLASVACGVRSGVDAQPTDLTGQPRAAARQLRSAVSASAVSVSPTRRSPTQPMIRCSAPARTLATQNARYADSSMCRSSAGAGSERSCVLRAIRARACIAETSAASSGRYGCGTRS